MSSHGPDITATGDALADARRQASLGAGLGPPWLLASGFTVSVCAVASFFVSTVWGGGGGYRWGSLQYANAAGKQTVGPTMRSIMKFDTRSIVLRSCLLLGLAAGLLSTNACGPEDSGIGSPESTESTPSTEQVLDTARTETGAQLTQAADGLPIAFEDRGEGDTTLVFVHCWACSRHVWDAQMDAFDDDYRVVAIDLGGHGESGRDRETWTLDSLAGDVEAVVEHLGLERVILIGHSMGGPVALASIPRLDAEVIGLIPVDTLQNVESQWPPEAARQLVGQFEADYEGTMRRMMPAMFPASADPEIVEGIVQQALRADHSAAMALLLDFPRLELPAMMQTAGVRVRAINAEPYSEASLVTAVDVNRKYADYDVRMMDGVGHFLQVEAPAAFNERLRETLAELTSR